MLFLPGLSMIAGGFKYSEQKFNPRAAGVGSLLLFIAIVGTVFESCEWSDVQVRSLRPSFFMCLVDIPNLATTAVS